MKRFSMLCATGCLALAGLISPAAALTVTSEECGEGADFIRNAALSRDNGIRADEFLGRLEGDLVAIRSVPAPLRWFARDADDEALLRTAAVDVFVTPRRAAEHHADFLSHCRARVALESGPVSSIDRSR